VPALRGGDAPAWVARCAERGHPRLGLVLPRPDRPGVRRRPRELGTTLAEHLSGPESISFAREGIESEQRDWERRTDHPDADGLYFEITWDGMHGAARWLSRAAREHDLTVRSELPIDAVNRIVELTQGRTATPASPLPRKQLDD
jgi:hypothetical protein